MTDDLRPASIDVERLRRAVHVVSVRHDWAHVVDTEDRTQEIVDAYEADPDPVYQAVAKHGERITL